MRPRIRSACLVMLLAALSPSRAGAQPSDPRRAAAAQELYNKATAEMDAGHYQTACNKLEEVTKLAPEGIGARLTLGECYEKLGRLASAWGQYAAAETMAKQAGRGDRARAAGAKAAELRPKLGTITVVVPAGVEGAAGLAIARDGVPVDRAQWGLAMPVDRGEITVEVTANGRASWSRKVEVKDGAASKLEVGLGAMLPVAPPDRPPPDKGKDDGATARGWQKPLGIAALSIGVAGLVAGGVLGGLAISKKDESNRGGKCDASDSCDADGLALRDQALGLGNGSTAAFIAGGVLAAGGVVLIVTAPAPGKGAAASLSTGVRIEARPNGFSVRVSW